MNVVREIQRINEQEAVLALGASASWHEQYKDSAYIFVGGLPYELTEGDIICVFSQYVNIYFHAPDDFIEWEKLLIVTLSVIKIQANQKALLFLPTKISVARCLRLTILMVFRYHMYMMIMILMQAAFRSNNPSGSLCKLQSSQR